MVYEFCKSCEFFETLKNTFFDRTPPVVASGLLQLEFTWLFIQISLSRSSRSEVFCKKVLLEISQNSQENTCTRVSFSIKLQDWGLQLY